VDPNLYFSVLRRFKLLVAAGVLLAVALAILSVARVSTASPHATYRQHELWQGYTTLLVSPPGFPWGASSPSPASDPAVYSSLALVYAKLVTSDAVRHMVLESGPIHGRITASYVSANPASTNGAPLPLIAVAGTGTSAREAARLADRASEAFLRYLRSRADENNIPQRGRVSVSVLSHSDPPVLLQGRSKTLPIVIFLVVMLATCALAFALERARPSLQAVASPELAPAATRRTA
jgi:hypothetical protein